MTFFIENDVRIAAVPVKDFRVLLYDGRKKSMGPNRCNGGFFGTYHEGGQAFTLPAGHLVCDYAATNAYTRKYCTERGRFHGEKFFFDSSTWTYQNQFHGRAVSTLVIEGGTARVEDLGRLPTGAQYAIAGVPIMRDGHDVELATYVKGQGWGGSSLRATWHVFVGLKEQTASTVYVMAARTKTPNMVQTAEAYKKFAALGFRDVLKLDGGGSFYFNAAGTMEATRENRRVCSIIELGGNPYPVPSVVLLRWIKNTSAVCWLQWELTAHGFPCEVDGSFGPETEKQLRAFQASAGLEVDGRCGPATKTALLKA